MLLTPAGFISASKAVLNCVVEGKPGCPCRDLNYWPFVSVDASPYVLVRVYVTCQQVPLKGPPSQPSVRPAIRCYWFTCQGLRRETVFSVALPRTKTWKEFRSLRCWIQCASVVQEQEWPIATERCPCSCEWFEVHSADLELLHGNELRNGAKLMRVFAPETNVRL